MPLKLFLKICGLFCTVSIIGMVPFAFSQTNAVVPTGINEEFTSVAAGNGTFVAGGGAGTLFYKHNNLWVKNTEFAGKMIVSVTFAANQFVAVFGQGDLATSKDGVTWKKISYSPKKWFSSLSFGLGNYLLTESGVKFIHFSSNLTNWDAVAYTDLNVWLLGSAVGSTTYVAVGGEWKNNHAASAIFTSTDGSAWSSLVNADFDNSAPLVSVATDGRIFVAVSEKGEIFRSEWGTSWTKIAYKSKSNLKSIRFLPNLEKGGSFVAVGEHTTVLKSKDGRDFAPYGKTEKDFTVNDVACDGQTLVLVGKLGNIIESTIPR